VLDLYENVAKKDGYNMGGSGVEKRRVPAVARELQNEKMTS
jgi:hypothetical protein